MRSLEASAVTDCARSVDALRIQLEGIWRDPIGQRVVAVYWLPWLNEVRSLAADLQQSEAALRNHLAALQSLAQRTW